MPKKTPEEKAEIRRQTEAARDPNKDRSDHYSVRGSGKSLSRNSLSNPINLDEHIHDILTELDDQADRGAALIGAALVETCLKRAMLCRMTGGADFVDVMYERENAPLASFSSKIKIARAIGTIGPRCERDLNIIRRVRNLFAHSVLKINFQSEEISLLCNRISINDAPEWKQNWSKERRLYIGSIISMSGSLESEYVRLKDNNILPGLD